MHKTTAVTLTPRTAVNDNPPVDTDETTFDIGASDEVTAIDG